MSSIGYHLIFATNMLGVHSKDILIFRSDQPYSLLFNCNRQLKDEGNKITIRHDQSKYLETASDN